MKHYLFEDLITGEEFIVGSYTLDEASVIAAEYFEKPKFRYCMSEFEAEASGLDEF